MPQENRSGSGPAVSDTPEVVTQPERQPESAEREMDTGAALREFFRDPERASLLRVPQEDEVGSRDLPSLPVVDSEPTEAELASVRARLKAAYHRGRERRVG